MEGGREGGREGGKGGKGVGKFSQQEEVEAEEGERKEEGTKETPGG